MLHHLGITSLIPEGYKIKIIKIQVKIFFWEKFRLPFGFTVYSCKVYQISILLSFNPALWGVSHLWVISNRFLKLYQCTLPCPLWKAMCRLSSHRCPDTMREGFLAEAPTFSVSEGRCPQHSLSLPGVCSLQVKLLLGTSLKSPCCCHASAQHTSFGVIRLHILQQETFRLWWESKLWTNTQLTCFPC